MLDLVVSKVILMTKTDVMINELQKAELFKHDGLYGQIIENSVKDLLLVFQKQRHSGETAYIASQVFCKLVNGEVLSPLTDAPNEWAEVDSGLYQNIRCSSVFKGKETGEVYRSDAIVYSDDNGISYFTSRHSRVYFTLPGYPPQKKEVVFTNREQYEEYIKEIE